MKVLQINSVCGYGSTGNIVVDLYQALERQGYECCIAHGRGTTSDKLQTYTIGKSVDLYLHVFLSRITDKQGFYSTEATKKFVKWIQEYNPDMIHLHNLHGYYINIEILFDELKRLDKPVIWTLHDCWAFTGHCSYYSAADCHKWLSGCEHCEQKRQYPKSLLLDNSQSNYEKKKSVFQGLPRLKVITPSYWLAEEVRKSMLGCYPVDVIYNGIDLNIFKPTKSDFRKKYRLENKSIILGVANIWTQRKGLQVFDDLAKRLDETYKIVLVGITKRQEKQIDHRILCIERTENKVELAEIYSTADVFLNPSSEETMGLTTVEALACGTNVLVYNRTALPEIVKYDETYIVYNEQMLISRLQNLAGRDKNTEKNRAMVTQYEKGQQYHKYIEQYEMLCKNEIKKYE